MFIFCRLFVVKPKCGIINGDYQIVVFQLLKTCKKESLYAERWSLVFDGFGKNSVIITYTSIKINVLKLKLKISGFRLI